MHPSRCRPALQADDSLSIVSGKPKRRKVLRDEQGEYRFEVFFVNGKQKRMKVRLIDGIPVSEFMARNADDIFLLQSGQYEILHEREMRRLEDQPPLSGNTDCGQNGLP